MMFYEDTLNCFKVTERMRFCHDFVTEIATYKVQRDVTQSVSIQELWFLHSACRLMLVNICMKFHDGILNGFIVTERTRAYRKNLLFSISKGHNSKNTQSRVTNLALCTSSHFALHMCKVSWKYLKRFFSYRADTILWQTDGRTDRRTNDPGKNNMSPNPKGGRHY